MVSKKLKKNSSTGVDSVLMDFRWEVRREGVTSWKALRSETLADGRLGLDNISTATMIS